MKVMNPTCCFSLFQISINWILLDCLFLPERSIFTYHGSGLCDPFTSEIQRDAFTVHINVLEIMTSIHCRFCRLSVSRSDASRPTGSTYFNDSATHHWHKNNSGGRWIYTVLELLKVSDMFDLYNNGEITNKTNSKYIAIVAPQKLRTSHNLSVKVCAG